MAIIRSKNVKKENETDRHIDQSSNEYRDRRFPV